MITEITPLFKVCGARVLWDKVDNVREVVAEFVEYLVEVDIVDFFEEVFDVVKRWLEVDPKPVDALTDVVDVWVTAEDLWVVALDVGLFAVVVVGFDVVIDGFVDVKSVVNIKGAVDPFW